MMKYEYLEHSGDLLCVVMRDLYSFGNQDVEANIVPVYSFVFCLIN